MIDFDNTDDLVNKPKSPTGTQEYNIPDFDDNGVDPGTPTFRGDVQVGGMTDLGFSQFDENTPFDTLQNLDVQRAEEQPLYHQAGNAIAQAVVGEIIGGTIEGLGYLLDVGSVIDLVRGEETDFGNFITDFGQSIREGTEESTRIYEDPNREEGFWNSMGDSGWWFKNSVSVASTLSMLIPSTAATKTLGFLGKGLSKGMGVLNKSLDVAENMGTKAKWMTEGLSQAVISRNIENWMEAHGTFEDLKSQRLQQINPETGVNFTEEEATLHASEAAAENWRNGWAMLVQDIPQYLALGKVFNPVTRKMENALGNASRTGITANLKPWQQKFTAAGGTFLSEGGEEAYQFIISERAKLSSDLKAGLISQEEFDNKISEAYGSDELKTSAFFGGLGGNVFQVAGKGINQAFNSKSRKEYEENIGKVYMDRMKSRATQMAAMQQELARADQDGLSETRKEVIDNMMMQMTAEALENDKFESFKETIQGMANMSEEDKVNFAEVSEGNEFDAELAKQYTPDILNKADEMRARYLKHRNKFSPDIAAKISMLEIDNKRWSEKKNNKSKNIKELRDTISDAWNRQASDLQKTKWERSENKEVLHRRIKSLKSQKSATKSKEIKGFLDKIIKANESKLGVVNNEIKKAEKDEKNMDAVQREIFDNRAADNELAQSAYDTVKDDVISAKEIDASIDDKIAYNNAEIAYTRTPEGKAKFEKFKQQNHINNLTNEKDITEAIDAVSNNDIFTDQEKKDLTSSLKSRLNEIELKKKKEEARLAAEKDIVEAEARTARQNSEAYSVDNQKRNQIEDNIEDPNWNEEVDTTEVFINSDEDKLKSDVDGSRTIPLLDKVKGTDKYQKWVENTAVKVGEEFEYMVSNRVFSTNKMAQEAIEMFKESSESNIPQQVYDSLPIMVRHTSKTGVFTYIPEAPKANASPMMHERYNNNYASQRKIIIDRLKAGEDTKTKIKFSSGGELVTDSGTEGMAAENSILDLQQFNNSIDNVDIMFTDDDGNLMNTSKEMDSDFYGKVINVGKDSDNNLMPYRGGVFLKVKKADGKIFPLRLNFARNTTAQSEILAGLLTDIAVPVTDENGEKKKILKLDSYLSDVQSALKERIETEMAPELTLLGKDTKINDLINLFVYVSDKTKDLTSELYFSGEHLIYGGKRITPGNRNIEGEIKNLVDFLSNTKRRQVSINMWNNLDGYKNYILENKVLSTNATKDGPMFQNKASEGGRRIQNYLGPLMPMRAKRGSDPVSPQKKEILDRMDKTIKIGMNKNHEGVEVATYWYPKSSWKTRDFKSMEDAVAKYQEEIDDLSEEKVKSISNDAGSERTSEESKALASEIKAPKFDDIGTRKSEDKSVSSSKKKRKVAKPGAFGKKTFNDNNTGAINKKCSK